MQSRILLLVTLLFLVNVETFAAPPGDKRTILTSGEKVYTIHYQLGQSTVLYFGLKPETVICGNKNYFNIEKIKDGITVQPLSNFSTNLTVMAQGRRYLFFLTPANGARPDGFVELKWVPTDQVRAVKPLAKEGASILREIGQKIKLTHQIEISILREKTMDGGKRRIFELELKNLSTNLVSSNAFEVVASIGGLPLDRQVLVWENEDLKPKASLKGRIIVSDQPKKALSLIVGYMGKSTKILIKGGAN